MDLFGVEKLLLLLLLLKLLRENDDAFKELLLELKELILWFDVLLNEPNELEEEGTC
eukprot:m.62944 g.62944  ORF g.62944 m.62944 type:complete len:57 (-) comp11423_c0_seq2:639-809(-)